MNTARTSSVRPVFRCLNAPRRAPRPQYRNISRDAPLPKSRTEAEALFKQTKYGVEPDLNHVSVHRAEALRRAYYIRRRNWLALGAALSMIAPMFLVRLWDVPLEEKKSEDEEDKEPKSRGVIDLVSPRPTRTESPRAATDSFQGKKVVVAAGDKILATPEGTDHPSVSDPNAIELVPTGTSHVPYFPRIIDLPTSTGPEEVRDYAQYTLIGLGIRTVSFLSIQVYVVGLYIKTQDLSAFQNSLVNTVNPTASALIPSEKDTLRKALLDPEQSEKIWSALLSKQGTGSISMALRVVPTRGTDFKHLQDGWMRGIASRTDEVRRKQQELLRQQATEEKRISLPKPVDENEFSDESFGLAMKEFKGMFQGRGKAPKGSIILLTRDKAGALGAYYQLILKTEKGEKAGPLSRLGEIRDERVSRLMWQLYFSGKNVSSEDARKRVVDGCIQLVERPVGTVEGMVQ